MRGGFKSDLLIVCTVVVPGIAERTAVLLGKALMARGYRVSALLRDPLPTKELASKFRLAKIPVHTSSHLGMGEGVGRIVSTAGLARNMKEYGPKAVCFHIPGTTILSSDIAAAKLCGAKRVVATAYSTHEALSVQEEERRSPLANLDAIVVSTPGMEAGVMAAGVPHSKIRMISNAVELSLAGLDRRQARNRFRIPPGSFAVGTLSNLTRERRVDQIIRACAASKEFKRKGFLVIVGDGPERQRLAAMASDMIPAQHLFVTSVEEPAKLYEAIDLFIFASEPPEFGHAFAEAGAWWAPTLAFDVGAAQYIIEDSRNGFLVPKDNLDEMAAKMDLLIQDKTVWGLLGDQARAIAESQFSPEKMADAYEELLHLRHK